MTPQAKQTATTFLSSVNFILPALPHDEQVPKLKQLVYTSSDSCGSFGQCDEYLRLAERSAVFGQPQQVIDFNIQRGERFNIIGLNTLVRALEHINEIVGIDLGNDFDIPPTEVGKYNNFLAALKDDLADVDVKKEDAQIILDIFNEVVGVYQNSGENGLTNYIKLKLEELHNYRSSDNKGRVSNLPWWKIVAIAALIGIAIFVVVRCFRRNKCEYLVRDFAYLAQGIYYLVKLC